MRPTDNNTQPGTGKNARRMCLRHQTIQYFCVIGTKIEKRKKKRGKNQVFEVPRFLGRGFCRGKLQSRVATGLERSLAPGQLLPGVLSPGIGAQLRPQHIPTARAITYGEYRGALLGLAPGGAQIRGCWRPQPTPSTVGRGAVHRNAAFPQKNPSLRWWLARLSPALGALGQGEG